MISSGEAKWILARTPMSSIDVKGDTARCLVAYLPLSSAITAY